ncbi:putative bifunctional diguanylate cyclase/phosphodiesterase [Euzebya tangerina]|uniref:putative bifunctional diguanylate cyclase/phosphodiesterase n=1 Tax=Euzebya tangerina TaxID=591198 RepID=UPI000E31BB8A|nr:EAL domain-containing protein [Euzebya tangerina]
MLRAIPTPYLALCGVTAAVCLLGVALLVPAEHAPRAAVELLMASAAGVASFWRASRVPRGQALPWLAFGSVALGTMVLNTARRAADFETFAAEAASPIRIADVVTRVIILFGIFAVVRLRSRGSHIELLVDGLVASLVPLVVVAEVLIGPAVADGAAVQPLIVAAGDFFFCCTLACLTVAMYLRGPRTPSLTLILGAALAYVAHSLLLVLATATPGTPSAVLTGVMVTGGIGGLMAAGATLPPSAQTLTDIGEPQLPRLGLNQLVFLSCSVAALPIGLMVGPSWPGEVRAYAFAGLAVLAVFVPRVNAVLRQRDAAIDRQQATQRDLRRRVSFDQHTGLPNRQMIERYLADSLRLDPQTVAVLFMDLDDFKLINDNFGHAAGDDVLASVADRLLMAQGPSELVARFGGDEFIVVLTDAVGVSDAVKAGHRYVAAASGLESVAEYEVRVQSSCGVAMADHASTPESLIRDADLAMYAAKRGSVRVVPFNDVLRTASLEQLRVEQGLRRALRNDELMMQYQPLVDLEGDRVVGAEALVRWKDSAGVVHSPHLFIDVAERSGLIHQVGHQVLEMVCEQIARWRDQAIDIPVSINVSANELARDDYVTNLLSTLQQHQVPPSSIVIELTERAIVGDSARLINALGQLRAAGISIAVDDFGTGYFSFSQLRSIPIDVLKIDRSFVKDMMVDPAAASIVRACLELAAGVDVPCTAEGVESADVLEELMSLGCRQAQGFHLGRPMPAADVGAIVQSQTIPDDPSLLDGFDRQPGQ